MAYVQTKLDLVKNGLDRYFCESFYGRRDIVAKGVFVTIFFYAEEEFEDLNCAVISSMVRFLVSGTWKKT